MPKKSSSRSSPRTCGRTANSIGCNRFDLLTGHAPAPDGDQAWPRRQQAASSALSSDRMGSSRLSGARVSKAETHRWRHPALRPRGASRTSWLKPRIRANQSRFAQKVVRTALLADPEHPADRAVFLDKRGVHACARSRVISRRRTDRVHPLRSGSPLLWSPHGDERRRS